MIVTESRALGRRTQARRPGPGSWDRLASDWDINRDRSNYTSTPAAAAPEAAAVTVATVTVLSGSCEGPGLQTVTRSRTWTLSLRAAGPPALAGPGRRPPQTEPAAAVSGQTCQLPRGAWATAMVIMMGQLNIRMTTIMIFLLSIKVNLW